MLSCEQVRDIVTEGFPGATVEVRDMTGTSDHFEIQVTSQTFAGKSLLEQHKLVHEALGEHFGDGKPIHAIKIKTRTP
jgi:stress-induced morphogen